MLLRRDQTRQALLQMALRPLVRFCIKRSICLTEILEALKRELVSGATAEISGNESKVTVSKVAAMTGITRREVTRIMANAEPLAAVPSLCGRVLGQWENDRRFCSVPGRPRALRFGFEGSEFSKLVNAVSKDTNPASVLFELQRLKAVSIKANLVRMESREAYHRPDPHRAFDLIFRNVEDMIQSGEENLEAVDAVKNLFLRTEFTRIPRRHVPVVRRWILRTGSEFHKRVRGFLARYDADFDLRAISGQHEEGSEFVKVAVASFSLVLSATTDTSASTTNDEVKQS